MPTLRMRVTGGEDDVRAMMNLLQSLDGIEHVEEVGDLMPHMDDADSRSAGLSDIAGPDVHQIEIDAPNPSTARRVREAVEALAFDLDTGREVVNVEVFRASRREARRLARAGSRRPSRWLECRSAPWRRPRCLA